MVTTRNHCVLIVFITMTIMLTTSSAGKMTETQRLKRKIQKMTRQMVGFEHDLHQAEKNITNVQATVGNNNAAIATNIGNIGALNTEVSNNSVNIANNMVKIQNNTNMIQAYHPTTTTTTNPTTTTTTTPTTTTTTTPTTTTTTTPSTTTTTTPTTTPYECPTGLNYRSIDGGCYYFPTERQETFETAQTDCDTRFPNGGHLYEPQSLNIDKKVMDASLEVLPGNRDYYIGVKRETIYTSVFKLFSSGITVPFEINWVHISYPSSQPGTLCIMAQSSGSYSGFRWWNYVCDYNTYSICESATTTTKTTTTTTTTATTTTTPYICPTENSTSTTWFEEVAGKCYYIMNQGCPDGNGCTLQEAQTICGSVFGSDTSGIVLEPTTKAINDAVLKTAYDTVGGSRPFWIGVNYDDLTYYSNSNPVSIDLWSDYKDYYDYDDTFECVGAYSSSKDWWSFDCDNSKMSTICEMTS